MPAAPDSRCGEGLMDKRVMDLIGYPVVALPATLLASWAATHSGKPRPGTKRWHAAAATAQADVIRFLLSVLAGEGRLTPEQAERGVGSATGPEGGYTPLGGIAFPFCYCDTPEP